MRKKLLLIAAALVILGLIAILPSFTTRNSIIINAPIDEVSSQFNKTDNLKKWYPGLSSKTFQLTLINPAVVTIRKSETVSVLIAESVNNGMSTRVNMENRTNGLGWVRDKLSGENTILQCLKSYLENDSLRYGLPISVIAVYDTLILTKRTTTTTNQVQQSIQLLRNQLMQFIAQHHIPIREACYFVSSAKLSVAQTEVAVGIPVTSTKEEASGYEFLKLPKTGRLVSAHFTGKYEEKNILYTTLDKYISDKRLKKVAQPLEKYNFKDTLLNAHKNMTITLYYPIY